MDEVNVIVYVVVTPLTKEVGVTVTKSKAFIAVMVTDPPLPVSITYPIASYVDTVNTLAVAKVLGFLTLATFTINGLLAAVCYAVRVT